MDDNESTGGAAGITRGPLSERFLSRSVGTLDVSQPLAVSEGAMLADVLALFRSHRVGCVLVTAADGSLAGLFSERDWILKVADSIDITHTPVRAFMTENPRTVALDTPISHALHLMSAGGFRHLPIVDNTRRPVGVVSVKDVVDRLVELHAEALLSL